VLAVRAGPGAGTDGFTSTDGSSEKGDVPPDEAGLPLGTSATGAGVVGFGTVISGSVEGGVSGAVPVFLASGLAGAMPGTETPTAAGAGMGLPLASNAAALSTPVFVGFTLAVPSGLVKVIDGFTSVIPDVGAGGIDGFTSGIPEEGAGGTTGLRSGIVATGAGLIEGIEAGAGASVEPGAGIDPGTGIATMGELEPVITGGEIEGAGLDSGFPPGVVGIAGTTGKGFSSIGAVVTGVTAGVLLGGDIDATAGGVMTTGGVVEGAGNTGTATAGTTGAAAGVAGAAPIAEPPVVVVIGPGLVGFIGAGS
jgi:hypothetical protein